ncbi:S9 family peptidase [Halovivax gelatinilyticus]|uniref:S9 family peptidase n=1 Tax=Halovivax gelatinilyticus TaxID=2961597 RepID=UPI0020CA3C18|nr:S9 family peptidase [Halovivax gelatinilyticus]
MTRPLREYLAAHATRAPSIAPDGRLAFLADTTGTMQVWTVEAPRRWPVQRTAYDNRVSFADWSPDGVLAFGKDAGADEHDQLFCLDPETNAIAQLTDDPDAIHLWGGWSPDGDRIAFTANRRDRSTFDVHVMDVADVVADPQSGKPDDPAVVSEGEGGFYAIDDWSPDGDRLLVSTAHASSDTDLFVVDIESGERRHVTPHDGHVLYTHAAFGPDGGVYCLSDANADGRELVRIDVDSLDVETVVDAEDGVLDVAETLPESVEAVHTDDAEHARGSTHDHPAWPIDDFVLDAESGRLAYTRNVEGYSVAAVGRLASATDVAAVPLEHPTGVVSELSIGPNGERVAMTVSATNLNYSIYVADATDVGEAAPETTRWTVPSTGGVTLDQYHEPELIRYETFDVDGVGKSAREASARAGEIPAFFTLPEDAKPGETPVIVDIHGGPAAQRRPSWRNRPIRQYFLDAGYALFEPNVRGSTGYGKTYAALDDVEKRMDSVRDIDAAVDWLADHPMVDEDRLVCYGRSYGGFMVLAAITEYPEHWAAAVDFVGIANWVTFLENTGAYRRSHREAEYGSLKDDREFLESISPIHRVDRIQCPLFVQHGENDPRVPVDEARQIADAVAERGIPVETCIFEDEGHHTTSRENRIEQFERIVDFLDEHVG